MCWEAHPAAWPVRLPCSVADLHHHDPKLWRDHPIDASRLAHRIAGTKRKTSTIKKTLNPTFNESLTYDFDLIDDVNIHNCVCQLEVWDWDRWESNDFLGAVQIPLVDANE